MTVRTQTSNAERRQLTRAFAAAIAMADHSEVAQITEEATGSIIQAVCRFLAAPSQDTADAVQAAAIGLGGLWTSACAQLAAATHERTLQTALDDILGDHAPQLDLEADSFRRAVFARLQARDDPPADG